MAISKVYPSVQSFSIGKVAPIPSQKLNDFIRGTAISVAALSNRVNDIAEILNTAPDLTDGSVSLFENGLDGSNIYMDNSADSNSVFFDANAPDGDGGTGRPVTIKEAYYELISQIGQATNYLREGISIGEVDNPVTVNASSSIEYDWAYGDRMFDAFLYVKDGSGIVTRAPSTVEVSVNTNTNKIVISNTDSNNIDIWGALLHPIFLF